MTADEIEMAFVREFQLMGLELGPQIGRESRMNRIRVEIFRCRRSDSLFFDSGMTYAQAFRRCYGRAAEMRAVKRDAHDRPTQELNDFDDDAA